MTHSRRTRIAAISAVLTALGLAGVLPAAAAGPVVERTASPPDCPAPWLGTTGNTEPTISASGRYVAFAAFSPDDDSGGILDILLRDVRNGTTTAILHSSATNSGTTPVISDDGSRVAYLRYDPNDPGSPAQLYVYDRRTHASTAEGAASEQDSLDISSDGRFVTFTQERPGTGSLDVYRRDVERNTTTLVSATPQGAPGNASSLSSSISGDGRYVAFGSDATDLTAGSAGPNGGLFLRDLRTRTTTVVPDPSSSPAAPVAAAGYNPRLSQDGRYVLYGTRSGLRRYDRATGTTVAASPPSSESYSIGQTADISGHGRSVAFSVSYQVGGDLGDSYTPVVVQDVRTGAQKIASAGPDGALDPNAGSYLGGITPDGRYVTFYSNATNLSPQDTDTVLDVFVRDLRSGTTTLVSSTHPGGSCES